MLTRLFTLAVWPICLLLATAGAHAQTLTAGLLQIRSGASLEESRDFFSGAKGYFDELRAGGRSKVRLLRNIASTITMQLLDNFRFTRRRFGCDRLLALNLKALATSTSPAATTSAPADGHCGGARTHPHAHQTQQRAVAA